MTAPTGWASVRRQLIDQSLTDELDSVIGDRWRCKWSVINVAIA